GRNQRIMLAEYRGGWDDGSHEIPPGRAEECPTRGKRPVKDVAKRQYFSGGNRSSPQHCAQGCRWG
ncbi:hypothetical protein, partial [Salmonella sp. M206]|uniref:hypothetical protein n=1 Tax=Salmonella sp. M206 TaxID=3240295 RepID=UPI003529D61B